MCNVNGSKKAKYKMASIDSYKLYPLVYVPKASGVTPVAGEAPSTNTVVGTSADQVTISSSPRQEPTNAEQLIELIRSHKKINAAELRGNLNSDDPEVSQKAAEQYQVLSDLYVPNIRNQYATFDQVYKDADGFIYIAGRGLEPYSSSIDGKYPTKDALEKQADDALKQYLSLSSPISAGSKLAHINATGKEPTPEEQVEIAGLLKQEVEKGLLSKDEIRNIKNKLGDAHVALIPDEAPLKKVVEDLIDGLHNSSSRNKAWITAFGSPWSEGSTSSLSEQAKKLQEIRDAGGSIAYFPDLETALT